MGYSIIQLWHPIGGKLMEWIPGEDGFPEAEAREKSSS